MLFLPIIFFDYSQKRSLLFHCWAPNEYSSLGTYCSLIIPESTQMIFMICGYIIV